MISRKKFMALQEELIRKEKEIVGLRKEIEALKEMAETGRELSKIIDETGVYALQHDEAYELACKIAQICGRKSV